MDPLNIAKMLAWLAVLGAAVLAASKVIGTVARKAQP